MSYAGLGRGGRAREPAPAAAAAGPGGGAACAATRSCRCAIPAAAVCSTPMSPAVREELRFTASFAWIDVLLMVLAGCTGLTGRCGAGKSRGRSVMAFAAAQNRPR